MFTVFNKAQDKFIFELRWNISFLWTMSKEFKSVESNILIGINNDILEN